jgi:hypothetical protein
METIYNPPDHQFQVDVSHHERQFFLSTGDRVFQQPTAVSRGFALVESLEKEGRHSDAQIVRVLAQAAIHDNQGAI